MSHMINDKSHREKYFDPKDHLNLNAEAVAKRFASSFFFSSESTLTCCAFLENLYVSRNDKEAVEYLNSIFKREEIGNIIFEAVRSSRSHLELFVISKAVRHLSFCVENKQNWFESIFEVISRSIALNTDEGSYNHEFLISECSRVLKSKRDRSHPERMLQSLSLTVETSVESEINSSVSETVDACAQVAIGYMPSLWRYISSKPEKSYELMAFVLDLCKHFEFSDGRTENEKARQEFKSILSSSFPFVEVDNCCCFSSLMKYIEIVRHVNDPDLTLLTLSEFSEMKVLPTYEELSEIIDDNISSFIEIDGVRFHMMEQILLLTIENLLQESCREEVHDIFLSFTSGRSSAKRMILLFSQNDSSLFQMLSNMLILSTKAYTKDIFNGYLHPGLLLIELLELIAYDSSVLLDWLLSYETNCLEYLLGVTRFLSSDKFVLPLSAMYVFDELSEKLKKTNEKGIFPYNPSALVRRIDSLLSSYN